MQSEPIAFDVPEDILNNWQETIDLLAEVIGAPAALIMRVAGPAIEVFLASRGEGNPYHAGDTERLENSGLYCETVIRTQAKLLVPDALADEAWKENPDIKLGMVSYLGFPILLPDGKPFGTLCVLDNKPNAYSRSVEKLMEKFRGMIESHLELLYVNHVLGERNRRLTDFLPELQALRGIVSICSYCKKIKDVQGAWRPVEHYLLQHPDAQFSHGICPDCMERARSDFGESR